MLLGIVITNCRNGDSFHDTHNFRVTDIMLSVIKCSFKIIFSILVYLQTFSAHFKYRFCSRWNLLKLTLETELQT